MILQFKQIISYLYCSFVEQQKFYTHFGKKKKNISSRKTVGAVPP